MQKYWKHLWDFAQKYGIIFSDHNNLSKYLNLRHRWFIFVFTLKEDVDVEDKALAAEVRDNMEPWRLKLVSEPYPDSACNPPKRWEESERGHRGEAEERIKISNCAQNFTNSAKWMESLKKKVLVSLSNVCLRIEQDLYTYMEKQKK